MSIYTFCKNPNHLEENILSAIVYKNLITNSYNLVSLKHSLNLAMNCKVSIFILVVFSTIFVTTAYSRKCRTSRKIYYVENTKFLNWDAASSACEAKGMHLVSIENKEELEYLKIYIKTIYGK